ncbi:MAG: hypothetical protein KDB22_06705 [Planctomycetales bacterium]|nr:hypothetical protein [Planctomycetales bacterium]
MRKLIGTLVVGLLILAGVGVMRGWLTISTSADSEKANLGVSVDKEQLKEDAEKLKETVRGAASKLQNADSDPSTVRNNAGTDPSNSGLVLPPDYVPPQ